MEAFFASCHRLLTDGCQISKCDIGYPYMEEMAKRESGEGAAAGRALAEAPERHATAEDNFDDPDLYINRELSLLAFQHRVLEEAEDDRNPLLERVKFLSILGSNL